MNSFAGIHPVKARQSPHIIPAQIQSALSVLRRRKKPRRSQMRSGGAGTEKRPLQARKVTHLGYPVNPFFEISTKAGKWNVHPLSILLAGITDPFSCFYK